MSLKTFKSGDRVHIILPKTFGFEVRNEFRSAIQDNPPGIVYELDFTEVEKMDSSAMGMLLLLKEAAGGEGFVLLSNVRPDIVKLLHLASFNKLFSIA
ncbi:STAS domain-containing protein [Candidatus Magnetaquicoccus inordinatus]|uniref:STAS domain-containing protein n=1 Tax=Candidatus Magnetaquicoccus inordinatus TaxID=2496818 RepID=UPI00102B5E72|nr:STAS domain-containing protein [Candidatus Magnetaquicoccus inordinatus]